MANASVAHDVPPQSVTRGAVPGRDKMSSVAPRTTSLALPSWLPPEVWPFKTTQLDVDGSAIAVAEAGTGPVLLFYTGIGSFVWRDVMVRLSADFRCVVLDPPGIGLSAPVARSAITLANSARAVAAVIDALGLQAMTLVLHDTGCPPALAAASRTPDRIRGIVGVNTFGWKPAGAAFRGMLAAMGSPAMRRIDLATGVLARVTSTAFGVGRHLDEKSRRAYRAGLARSMGAFHDYLGEARFSDDIYAEVTSALAGPFRRLPLLTIFGERNDPLGFQPQWKRLFPHCRQITIPKGNHFPMCDAPDLVADSIRSWHQDVLRASKEIQR
jgi:pimeloyl-ACP methyl ester carboxylesterase